MIIGTVIQCSEKFSAMLEQSYFNLKRNCSKIFTIKIELKFYNKTNKDETK